MGGKSIPLSEWTTLFTTSLGGLKMEPSKGHRSLELLSGRVLSAAAPIELPGLPSNTPGLFTKFICGS
jgi:hypothetical protein